jgi:prepilin-type N-terminal cleavage/methylation domain-containing protein
MFRQIKFAFTLVELLIVIVIMGVVYSLVAPNLNIKSYVEQDVLNFKNIHNFLTKYSYESKITLKCTNEDGCFIVSDGSIVEQIENKLFKGEPVVYHYHKNLDVKEFSRLELENLESYDVVFEYEINKDGISKDMIVEVDEKVYIFNSFKNQVIDMNYTSDIADYFDKKDEKVRDAF